MLLNAFYFSSIQAPFVALIQIIQNNRELHHLMILRQGAGCCCGDLSR